MTPSPIDRPGAVELLAQMYVDGLTHVEIAEEFNSTPRSVPNWLKRADVQARAAELGRARVNRVTRKIDSIIEARLEHTDKIDTETLLKIRKELSPQRIEVGRAGEFDKAAEAAAWAALDAGEEPPAAIEAVAEEIDDDED